MCALPSPNFTHGRDGAAQDPLPLQYLFWAAYLMTTSTPGISAVQLQRRLGLSRYESAWTMLHKLRRAMVNPERTLLTVEVEVYECEVGGVEKGRSGGRSRIAKTGHIVVAVEVRGQGSGRIRMHVIPDASGPTLYNFVHETVEPGAVVHTDGWGPYVLLAKNGYDHRPRSQRAAKRTGDTEPVMPRVHRAISNFSSRGHRDLTLGLAPKVVPAIRPAGSHSTPSTLALAHLQKPWRSVH